ncbi:hypothetical protein EDI_299230 [Entamoeba dispar SAW760]|uniref:Uncharacterized protein n=1 Tax=Entamoeba dispar (strain ATCC PRA-260 / SAW760) TaxID=370354 RepID=B0E7E2_ENTDS|nr:uncharacterized protein EDI_299230 [Entamoeba dispar SAW760]EDR29548.1 hypothetical protein EDI_299230 [Entamoeba dispar SAW760]|eukprot:EDR29548.1 hypothetical protein EDI_299230 [Entamoeba dispar SAW760]
MKSKTITMMIDIEYDEMNMYLYNVNKYERIDRMKYLKEEEKKIIEEIISNDKKNVKIRKENIKGVEMMIKPESKLSMVFNNIKKTQKRFEYKEINEETYIKTIIEMIEKEGNEEEK